ncbi:MAG: acyl-CoA reductase [Porticoccaceae bacterium]
MNNVADTLSTQVPHIVRGNLVTGGGQDYGRFATPPLDVDQLRWLRSTAPPAANVPVDEIIDILVTLGDWLRRDPDGIVDQALQASFATNPLEKGVLERSFNTLGDYFDRQGIEFQINQELGGKDVLDGWRQVVTPDGRKAGIRAFPSRMLHVIAGNAPGVSAMTVVRGAITKSLNLIKLPSNDLYTATALLRGLSKVAPGHPVSQSFSAAYWRGGDTAVEAKLFQPLFFDKIVAWGGETTIRSAKNYIGPGLELVSFDPKTSISFVGREVHSDNETRQRAADAAARDVTVMDQQACVSSRFQFVEGSIEDVDAYCEAMLPRLGVERPFSSICGSPLSGTIREEIEVLRDLEPEFKVFGELDGTGVIIRSDEPVDFHPDGRVVNVVRVDDLNHAISRANFATQTVGIFPDSRRQELRDALAARGVQRVTALGSAGLVYPGLPHDGFYPLQRFVRWVNDED